MLDTLAKARQHDVALGLLQPANPEATLVEAVNNLRQVAAAAVGNCDTLEGRLLRCLRVLRDFDGLLSGSDEGSLDDCWRRAKQVVAECGVGIDLDGNPDTKEAGE